MPVSRSRKAPIHAEKPYEKSTSRRPKKSFGPISDQDPDIVAFDGVCAAREFNDARIASLLKTIVPCPCKKDWIQKTPSKSVSRPRFSSGKNGSELGRWYQVCYTDKGVYSDHITHPLDPDTISRAGSLSLWLAIREEIKPKPRTSPTTPNLTHTTRSSPRKPYPETPPSLSISSSRSTQHLSPMASSSQTTTPSSNSSASGGIKPFPQLSPLSQVAFTVAVPPAPNLRLDLLDLEAPVLLVVWLEDGTEPAEHLVYPRTDDGRLRLSDFKVSLGALGLEIFEEIELYLEDTQVWLPLSWSTGLRVGEATRVLFVRNAAISHLVNFKQLCEYHYPTVTGKGKQRA